MSYHNDQKNPFKGYDPRSLGIYSELKVPDDAVIPLTDDTAWSCYKEHRWVYNKLEVAVSQELACGPLGLQPEKFPVFLKPVYNMHGGGRNSEKISTIEEYEEKFLEHPGSFWMPFLKGEHLSHDVVVQNGEPLYEITFKGHPLPQGKFDYWEVVQRLDHKPALYSWITQHLSGWSGCANIETIGGKIIEVHLRMGDLDRLSDVELMQAIVDVYSGKEFKYEHRAHEFYLFALWGNYDENYTVDLDKAKSICAESLVYQIDDPERYYQNPPGGVRLAIIGTSNYKKGIEMRNELSKAFLSTTLL